MDNSMLSRNDFLNILCAKLGNKIFKFKSAEIKQLTEQKCGFTGSYFTLKIMYILDGQLITEHFFIKSQLERDTKLSKGVSALNIYNKEIFFYNVLCKNFKVLDFAPQMYLCKNDRILIFEDLRESGFAIGEKRNWFFDATRIECCLKALAHLHGASFIFEEDKSKELGKPFRLDEQYPEMIAKGVLTVNDPEDILLQFYLEGQKCLMELIELLDKDKEWKVDFKKRLAKKEFFDDTQLDLPFRKVCSHSDLWTNNIMFKCQDDKALDCRLVDFQLIRYLHPACDVLLLLLNNSHVKLHSSDFSRYLTYYYNLLRSVLVHNGYIIEEIFPWDHFQRGIDVYMYMTQFKTACNHTMLFFLDEDAIQEIKENDTDLSELLCQNRSALVVKLFKHNQNFRNVITEDLYNVQKLLYARHSK